MTKKNELITMNNVDISPLVREMVEYSKSQNAIGDLQETISKVPMGNSPDWKLISGVLCNSVHNEPDRLFPNNGIACRRIAIASNSPSHKMIGAFQLIRFSKNIMSLEASGFLYLK